MFFKKSPFSIQDKNVRDLDNVSRRYPTIDDLMKDQNITTNKANAVHRRRDLDALG